MEDLATHSNERLTISDHDMCPRLRAALNYSPTYLDSSDGDDDPLALPETTFTINDDWTISSQELPSFGHIPEEDPDASDADDVDAETTEDEVESFINHSEILSRKETSFDEDEQVVPSSPNEILDIGEESNSSDSSLDGENSEIINDEINEGEEEQEFPEPEVGKKSGVDDKRGNRSSSPQPP
ncbi:transcription elongation factor spt5-like isoform X1 [Diprion similis]|nr:transcription elongation factor spt5-like isoform X1 [Diprion similis]